MQQSGFQLTGAADADLLKMIGTHNCFASFDRTAAADKALCRHGLSHLPAYIKK